MCHNCLFHKHLNGNFQTHGLHFNIAFLFGNLFDSLDFDMGGRGQADPNEANECFVGILCHLPK